MMRWTLAVCFVAPYALAQGCAATPDAAALSVIGSSVQVASGGFRAEGLQVDFVMKRAWVRVVRCDDASVPAVLVPIAVPVHAVAAVERDATTHVPQAIAIQAGQTVAAAFSSSGMRMILQAVANEPGAVGQVISLTLKRRPGQSADEPEHRIRGLVRADRSVEVQP